jgi:hypothetical protein
MEPAQQDKAGSAQPLARTLAEADALLEVLT